MIKNVTIRDLAKSAGVSRSTVSRVLTNNPHVDPKTRDKVMRAMEHLQYAPNEVARSLVRGYHQHLSLIVIDIRNPFFAELARGVEAVGFENNCPVAIFNTDDDVNRERACLSLVERSPGVGAIIVPSQDESALITRINRIRSPFVLLSRYLTTRPEQSAVYFDNLQGAQIATEHLVSLGHTRIAYLEGPENSVACHDRTQGFTITMQHHNLEIDPSLIGHGRLRIEDGYHFARSLVLANRNFTALFCSSDLMAIGALRAFQEMKIRVPEDISVIGFDDIWLADLPHIKLTTIHQPAFAMGYRAAELILRPKENEPVHHVFRPSLVLRGTTAHLTSFPHFINQNN